MPSNLSPLGALPARFRRTRLLVVGCGDVGMRAVRLLPRRGVATVALTSSPQRLTALRAAGVVPLAGNLDDARSLRRLAGLADRILYLAPPPQQGEIDTRVRSVCTILARRSPPRAWVYGSTSGVYGDCGGARVMETRATRPRTSRAVRRVDAERHVRRFGRALGTRTSVLRIPGIYAPDREGGTPRARLLRGTPVLVAGDDVYTSHIHADDLARACLRALWRGAAQRIYHASDDTELRMGDYFDAAADLYGLPRPPRVARSVAEASLQATLLSFMGESRRLDNRRLREELGLRLRYPTVQQGLREPPRP